MKRIHWFEFEDQSWFPNWIRKCMTKYIAALHRKFGTSQIIADNLSPIIEKYKVRNILDLCSGSGGPMINTTRILNDQFENHSINLTMTDLYPNDEVITKFNSKNEIGISYHDKPINAAEKNDLGYDMMSMICSFHHMEPKVASSILQNAVNSQKPFYIFELSDNSAPIIPALIIGLPLTFIMTLVMSIFVRPMSVQQLVFTWLIPIIPLLIAWDGTISNLRTYTKKDLNELIDSIHSDNYVWDINTIKTKTGKMMSIIGYPNDEII